MGSNFALPLISCVTLGKCLTISGPLFPYRRPGSRSLPPIMVERIKLVKMWNMGSEMGTH